MAKKRETARITPVLLSGGSGTRLWPLSRALYPKQLYPLVGERSLLQETALRVADKSLFDPMLVIGGEAHRFLIAEQLSVVGVKPRHIVLEPAGRNTGPAAAAAACLAEKKTAGALLLVLPSDHAIGARKRFLEAVAKATPAAEAGALVTFGVFPTAPETGYGYVQRGAPMKGAKGCFEVTRFIEKPDRKTAEKLIRGGDIYWNSGIFLFRADRFLEELDHLQPKIVMCAREAVAKSEEDLGFLRLNSKAFKAAAAVSIDVAVMEKTQAAAVVPVEMGWSDVGSWEALQAMAKADGCGNVLEGDVLGLDVRNAYLRSEGPLVAALGVKDVIVVATGDAVLVVSRDRAQDVKTIVEKLRAKGRQEAASHPTVHRPWGSYRTVDSGERFQVKRLMVKPGAKLSLQKHRHRAEHWVVVEGTARVTKGKKSLDLRENESIYLPAGTIHRLANPGHRPLHLIEVQSGSYLGEDDIVRFDDVYGRVERPSAGGRKYGGAKGNRAKAGRGKRVTN
ncbi:MAG: mannose-1-phosphate guanylyltransferase/mannose-6-phosphate isomerase [Pseudomonadota bacterium]